LTIQILILVQETVVAVNFFDTRFDNDLEKVFILLLTTSGTAAQALMLDIIFRVNE
jgi:hypothetical protein